MGFFTDTTVCIGCKACEVACKQWNDLPADGGGVPRAAAPTTTRASSAPTPGATCASSSCRPDAAARARGDAGRGRGEGGGLPDLDRDGRAGRRTTARSTIDLAAVADVDRWVFMSDVCKHCTNAGCLDACPTGALIRTEFETVVLQPDVCNGCGYCVPSCPFGVVDRDPDDGRAAKCTLCYDRLEDGLEPACAKACPTDSIQFGPYDELVDVAQRRVATLHERGVDGRLPLRRRRPARRAARRRPGRVLPAHRAARALRAAGAGRLADPGERRARRRLAAVGAGLLAAAGVAAAFVADGRGRGARRRRRLATARPLVSALALARRRLARARERRRWAARRTAGRARHDARAGHARRPGRLGARRRGRAGRARTARLGGRALVVPLQEDTAYALRERARRRVARPAAAPEGDPPASSRAR